MFIDLTMSILVCMVFFLFYNSTNVVIYIQVADNENYCKRKPFTVHVVKMDTYDNLCNYINTNLSNQYKQNDYILIVRDASNNWIRIHNQETLDCLKPVYKDGIRYLNCYVFSNNV